MFSSFLTSERRPKPPESFDADNNEEQERGSGKQCGLERGGGRENDFESKGKTFSDYAVRTRSVSRVRIGAASGTTRQDSKQFNGFFNQSQQQAIHQC
jgi:hypothetical protein